MEHVLPLEPKYIFKPSVQTMGTVFILKRKTIELKYVEIINGCTII